MSIWAVRGLKVDKKLLVLVEAADELEALEQAKAEVWALSHLIALGPYAEYLVHKSLKRS